MILLPFINIDQRSFSLVTCLPDHHLRKWRKGIGTKASRIDTKAMMIMMMPIFDAPLLADFFVLNSHFLTSSQV